ncbi:MAG: pyrroloquinoline quinone biosynthesis peptide chaperone PqqD [Rhodospirillales bacterium]|nr:pyrroloquinoline quinone biosynthesis peptide chaperone PqqD [Rhodospirillales bacterium]
MVTSTSSYGFSRPQLANQVRLTFDRTRGRWVILAPERLLVPNDVAVEILLRCDGIASVEDIADDLAGAFDATREVIVHDVRHLVDDLGARGLLVG